MKTTLVPSATTVLPQPPSRSGQRRRNRAPRALSWAMASAFSGAVATLSIGLPWSAAFAQNVNPATVQSNAKLPQGGQATVGSATYNYSANQLTVTTTNGAANRSAINWQSFNVGAGHTTHIAQPNAQSSSLNRVVTNQPSAIYGTLSSNGNVILVNQNGIAVGRGGVVDTAGFTASTLNMSDADYAAGKLKFQGNALSGSVQVDGTIRSANGDVMLFAPNVTVGRADAIVRAENGNVIIGAGQQVEVTGRGLEGVKFVIQSPDSKAINLGTLQGNAVGVFAGSLRHSGVINAQTASLEGGRIVLRAIKNVDIVKDTASTDGPKVLAEGGAVAGVGKAGGNITIQSTEGNVRIGAGAEVSANAGSALPQGLNLTPNTALAQQNIAGAAIEIVANQGKVVIEAGSAVTADGSPASSVRIFGGALAQVAGLVSAQSPARAGAQGAGLALGGDIAPVAGAPDASERGGRVHILSPQTVELAGSAQIDVSGDAGGGTILVGGDYQGANASVQNAQHTSISAGVLLAANARVQGDGGKVIVWADNSTHFGGSIEAKGGEQGGNGGLAETSGKQHLYFRGRADLSARRGRVGSLLLDPEDILIVGGGGGAQDAAFTAAGGSVNLGDLPATYTISEAALETVGATASVLLNANRSIRVAGVFTDGKISVPGGAFALQTENPLGSTPFAAGEYAIDMVTPAGVAVAVEAGNFSGFGVSMQSGQATSPINSPVRVGSISTSGLILITASGDIVVGTGTGTTSMSGLGGTIGTGRSAGVNFTVSAGATANTVRLANDTNFFGGVNLGPGTDLAFQPSAANSIHIFAANASLLPPVLSVGGTLVVDQGGSVTLQVAGPVSKPTQALRLNLAAGSRLDLNNQAFSLNPGGDGGTGLVTIDGTLNIGAGSDFFATSNPVTLTSGGVLSGTGAYHMGIRTLTIQGTVEPGGAGTVGALTIEGTAPASTINLVMDVGGKINFDALSATSYDRIFMTGTPGVNLNPASLVIVENPTTKFTAAGTSFDLISNPAGNTVNEATAATSIDAVYDTFNASGTVSASVKQVNNFWLNGITGDWTNAANWSRGRAPGLLAGSLADNAIIEPTGVQVVTIKAGEVVRPMSLQLTGNDDTLFINGGELTLSQAGAPASNVAAGSKIDMCCVNSTLSLAGHGLNLLSLGTGPVVTQISGQGTLLVDSASSVNGSANSGIDLSRLVNDGFIRSRAVTTKIFEQGVGGQIQGGLASGFGPSVIITNSGNFAVTQSYTNNSLVTDSGIRDFDQVFITQLLGSLALSNSVAQQLTANSLYVNAPDTTMGNGQINVLQPLIATGGKLTLLSANGVGIDPSAPIGSTGTGDAVVIDIGAGPLVNLAGAGAINTPNGRWLVFSDSPLAFSISNMGGLDYGLKQYGVSYANYSVTPSLVATTGSTSNNGVVFASTANLGGVLGGSGTKVYDRTDIMSTAGFSIDSIALSTGDILNFASHALDATGTVSSGKNVTVSPGTLTAGFSLASATANDALGRLVYGFATAGTATGGAADITARLLTASASGVNRVYDGSTIASVTLAATPSDASPAGQGFIVGDTLTLSSTAAAFLDKNAGNSKTVNVTGITAAGLDALNYSLANTSATTSADISRRSLSASASGVNRVYDGSTIASVTLGDDRIAGDVLTLSNSAASFLDKNAGNGKTVNVSGITASGADALNYSLASTSAATTADISRRGLNASASGINRVYDGSTIASVTLAATPSDASPAGQGFIVGDTLTLSSTAAAFLDKNAGNGKTVNVSGITVAGADALNYSLASTSAATTADISQRVLNASASGVNRVYDGSTIASVTLGDDRVLGDTLTLSSTAAAFLNKNAGNGKTVNVSGISLAGTDALNYLLANTSAATSADITPAELTINTITGLDKVYDGRLGANVSVGNVNIAGLVGAETVGITSAGGNYDAKDVGARTVAVTGISLTDGSNGGLASNYTVRNGASFTATGTIAIRPVAVWTGAGGNNLWSNAANWDALPDRYNVAAVSIATGGGGALVYDLADATRFDSLISARALQMTNGNLQVVGLLSSAGFTQTGGTLQGRDQVINGNLSQSGGSLTMTSITVNGAVAQTTGGAMTSQVFDAISPGSISLLGANRLGRVSATAGNGAQDHIDIKDQGASLDVGRLSAGGNATVHSSGLVSLAGNAVLAGGLSLSGQGVSIGADAAARDVILNAGAGNITISGAVRADSGSAVSVQAGNTLRMQGNQIAVLGTGLAGGTAQVNSNGTAQIDATGDVVIQGGSGVGAFAMVKSSGAMGVTVGGTLRVLGGIGQGAHALLDPVLGADLTVNAATVSVAGGSSAAAYGAITSQGNVLINASTLSLTPGAGLDADAVVVSYQGTVSRPAGCNGCMSLSALPLGDGVTQSGVFPTAVVPPVVVVVPPEVQVPPVTTAPLVPNEIDQFTKRFNQLTAPLFTSERGFGGAPDVVVGGEVCVR